MARGYHQVSPTTKAMRRPLVSESFVSDETTDVKDHGRFNKKKIIEGKEEKKAIQMKKRQKRKKRKTNGKKVFRI